MVVERGYHGARVRAPERLPRRREHIVELHLGIFSGSFVAAYTDGKDTHVKAALQTTMGC